LPGLRDNDQFTHGERAPRDGVAPRHDGKPEDNFPRGLDSPYRYGGECDRASIVWKIKNLRLSTAGFSLLQKA
jgi:hypothetical protein